MSIPPSPIVNDQNVKPLRLASYNLQKCVGLDMQRRPDRSLQVINAISPDIVVLQEADKRLPPRPAALPHDLLHRDDWQVLPFGPHGDRPSGSLGWHGNAMLVRADIQRIATDQLELPGLEPRGAICADVQTAIGPLRVVGVHLALIRRWRLKQLTRISQYLRHLPPMPTLIAGDFNEWGDGRALDHSMPQVTLLPPQKSFPAPRPIAPLDRVAISPDLICAGQGVYQGRPAHMASDHLPIWADILPA